MSSPAGTSATGHFHHLQLIEAIQEQCGFAPGDVRVVTLESQPAQMQRQRYRLYDAATGLIEEGWVDVAEMVKRGPWIDESWDFPVEVTSAVGEPAGARAERVGGTREHRDRRRLGAERACLRGRARPRGGRGDGARGRGRRSAAALGAPS